MLSRISPASQSTAESWCSVLQGVGAVEMNAGDQPVIGISTKYQDPGVYAVEVSGLSCQCCTHRDASVPCASEHI